MRWLLLLALALQTDVDTLQQEKIIALERGTRQDMVSIQAVHLDGMPAKGTIACEGWWHKYDEKTFGGTWMPFETDSRGVVIMNPWVNQYPEGEVMTCSAIDKHGHKGTASWEMPRRNVEIVVK